MSVNTDGMDVNESRTSYADHEIVNLAILSDGSGNADSFVSVDPTAEELERDQVAELVYYERNMKVAEGNSEFGLGFNVEDNSFLEQAAGNNPTDFDTGSPGFQGLIYEEPGIIDYTEIGSADDATNEQQRREIRFAEVFGEGPFVDSTDDLDLHLEFSDGGRGVTPSVGIQVQMAYKIHEVAGGVPEFANPRRLMDD